MPNLVSTIIDIVITNSFVSVILFLALLSGTFIFQLVSAQEQIRLEGLTDKGTFKIQLFWTSNEVGSPNVFEVRFIDPATGNEIEHVKYDISIYNQGKLEIERLDQISTFQEFSFEDVGAYEIRIADVEDLGEGTTIPIQVTPEFGLDGILLSAATLGVVLVYAVGNNNKLFR